MSCGVLLVRALKAGALLAGAVVAAVLVFAALLSMLGVVNIHVMLR